MISLFGGLLTIILLKLPPAAASSEVFVTFDGASYAPRSLMNCPSPLPSVARPAPRMSVAGKPVAAPASIEDSADAHQALYRAVLAQRPSNGASQRQPARRSSASRLSRSAA